MLHPCVSALGHLLWQQSGPIIWWVRHWPHKRYPIAWPSGQAMGCLFVIISEKIDPVVMRMHCILEKKMTDDWEKLLSVYWCYLNPPSFLWWSVIMIQFWRVLLHPMRSADIAMMYRVKVLEFLFPLAHDILINHGWLLMSETVFCMFNAHVCMILVMLFTSLCYHENLCGIIIH